MNLNQNLNRSLVASLVAISASLSGCVDPSGGLSGTVSSSIPTNPGGSSGTATTTPTPTNPGTSNNGLLDSAGYPSCVSTDSSHICIGLKVVAFTDSNDVPTLTESDAVTLVNGMNSIWSQCNIGFQLEVYQASNPADKGLSYNPNWQTSGDAVRSAYQEPNKFLVVAVGSLSGRTIAVTEMPGAGVYGTLVEKAYATNPMTVGHEIGHYQGLYHISDSTNLMNPYIGTDTRGLDSSQCATARSTDMADWVTMMR